MATPEAMQKIGRALYGWNYIESLPETRSPHRPQTAPSELDRLTFVRTDDSAKYGGQPAKFLFHEVSREAFEKAKALLHRPRRSAPIVDATFTEVTDPARELARKAAQADYTGN